MDANTAQVIIAVTTMVTTIATATIAYYTNRRTKRIEIAQKLLTMAVVRVRTTDDLRPEGQRINVKEKP